MPPPSRVPAEILAAWALDPEAVSAIEMGNINRTYVVRRGGKRYVLQWLNPISAPR